jgi:hypothetical protein
VRSRAQCVRDLFSDFGVKWLYYDRKESESVPVYAIEDSIIADEVTIDELVESVRGALVQSVEDRRKNGGAA